MKHTIKRVISFVFVLIMVMSLAAPGFAAGTLYPTEGPITVRMQAKKNGMVWIPLAYGDNKNFTINRADVKVSKGTAGAKLTNLEKNYRANTNSSGWYDSYEKSWQENSRNYKECQYRAGILVQNPGKMTVKYKVGSKEYKISVTVEAYKNPIKSITLTGYKNGKSFVSKTAAYKNLKLSANIKSAKLKIVAADGWKLQSMNISDNTAYATQGFSAGNGVTSGVIKWGKMLKSHRYAISATFLNSETGFSQSVYYYFN